MKIRSILALSLSVVSTTLFAAWEQGKEYHITILHTNDHHGHFWPNDKGEYGLAAQKTLVKQIRNEVEKAGGSVLLLSGGDINTGVPESDTQNAEPDFIGMNSVGYDAMALGNHEFDNPLPILYMQEKWASFPFLSANIYDEKKQTRLFKPYKIFEKKGVKIAVIGLTTEDTAKISNVEYVVGIEFRDPKVEAQKVIKELRNNKKPDIIIAVTHMGHYVDGKQGSNAPGDVELARYLKQGSLDMIVGGHSQNPVCMESENERNRNYLPTEACVPDRQNGTWIVQAHEWGKYVGRADFVFKNGELTLKEYTLLPVNLKYEEQLENGEKQYHFYAEEIKADPRTYALLKPYQDKGQKSLMLHAGISEIDLDGERTSVRHKQTNLGKLIALSQMERVKADFGLINGGGIRASLSSGTITYRDILTVLPFGNIIGYAEMNGKELTEYLQIVANIEGGSGGYAQFANIEFTRNKGKIEKIRISNQPIDMNKMYRFSLPTFCAEGGDGYPKINYINSGFIDAMTLKEYISKNSPIDVKLLK